MGSRKDKNMALKTQRAHQMQAQEAGLLEHFGDCAENLADIRTVGRVRNHIQYVGKTLPHDIRDSKGVVASVHYQDGTTRMFYSMESAHASLRECCALKIWDTKEHKYISEAKRRFPEKFIVSYSPEESARVLSVAREYHVLVEEVGDDVFSLRVSSSLARIIASRASEGETVTAEVV